MDLEVDGHEFSQATQYELQELRKAFDLFDQNKSGFIEKNELRNVLQVMGQNPTQEEVDAIITEADVIVRDGRIDFVEFVRIVSMGGCLKTDAQLEAELIAAFQVFDRDKNGYISRQELEFVLRSVGEQLSPEEIDELFNDADANEDGKISYKEFVVLFNQTYKETGLI